MKAGSPTKRLRRSTASGYARGDETRQRIIDAAIQLFGEHGFKDASTRDIAAAAGVNAPALQYYFENKEGLYKACAEYITDDLKARYAPSMKHAKDALKNNAGIEALIDAYMHMQATTLDSVLTQPHLSKGRLVGRELAGESPRIASEMLQRKMKQPINKLLLTLLARIMHTRPDDAITRIRMLTLKGLVLAFYYPPGACLELLEWKEIDANKSAMIKASVQEQTRTLLMSWHEAGMRKDAA
ncbi:CerR family C-terminal domain-containing protein [Dyella nitratireducens]|uniref:Transcriptional regulator n=1 Tax=Dyella nitratireducens TaxID=1849580 RepID=A0ABQ1GAW0_9GAMM|nr:CerR family C-terminal domain-containing protein [Dyella nitratireducens]GGA40059.1 transcriptional regulator [Dyella nitratireducens]GLQ40524.1 transcriptional regulator [Dyella nitratireducens]